MTTVGIGPDMKPLVLLVVVLLPGCVSRVPDDLARVVLLEQIGQIDGIKDGFVLCVATDGEDASVETLAALREVYALIVPRSECEWVMDTSKGSFHKPTGQKAMLINVFNDQRGGRLEFEARFHGRWATMRTLEVRRDAAGWRTGRVLRDVLAKTSQGQHKTPVLDQSSPRASSFVHVASPKHPGLCFLDANHYHLGRAAPGERAVT